MLSNELKPRTKEDLVLLQQAILTAKTREGATSVLPAPLIEHIEAEMKKNSQNYETVINDIKIYLSSMKAIKIYLAFEPSARLKERIIALIDLTHSDRYLEIIRDESIIGGAKVVIDGKLYDETIDKHIYEKCI